DYVDERLAGLVEPVPPAARALVPSHRALAARIVALWKRSAGQVPPPVVQLAGPDSDGKRALAAAARPGMGAGLLALPAMLLPTGPDNLTVSRLLTREAALGGAALLVDCDDLEATDTARAGAVSRLLDRTGGPLFVTSRERRRLSR